MKLDVVAINNENAAALVELGCSAIHAGDTEFDLSAVKEVDSAAVALLLAWHRAAQKQGKTLSVTGLPDDIRSLAKLYGVDDLLGLSEGLHHPG